jgi:hypothetical protein
MTCRTKTPADFSHDKKYVGSLMKNHGTLLLASAGPSALRRFDMRSKGVALTALAAISISACQPVTKAKVDEPPSSRPPTGKRITGLGLHGYNYTDMPIASYVVNGAWGGNLRVSSVRTGGGGTTCCGEIPAHLPTTYQVSWSRDDQRWCDIEVQFKGPIPVNPQFLNTHFFRDGHVEITVSEDFLDILVSEPDFHNGLSRNETGNVVMDEAFARCRNEK